MSSYFGFQLFTRLKIWLKGSDRTGRGTIAYQSISFDDASMIPAAQCSIFRATRKANSATLASSPHSNVSTWSAAAGGQQPPSHLTDLWAGMWRNSMQKPLPSNKKGKNRSMQHPPASDRVAKGQEAAGDGILIPQYSFHSDNKNRKIYTVAPQNRESSTYRF